MSIFKPFKSVRPLKENAHLVASRPYDVLNSDEAREEVKGNDLSFLHVVKPEIDLPSEINLYDDQVYYKGLENFNHFMDQNVFVEEDKACFYVYRLIMNGRTQDGIVGCSSVQDYLNNAIKKHELTRADKEEDRKNHVRITQMNAEPVFFTYPSHAKIDEIVNKTIDSSAPEYDFKTEDDIQHIVWVINNDEDITNIETLFKEIPSVYVADGHHRTAAAALVGEEMKSDNPNHDGSEEYNFFLSVLFPENQLEIIDYNRVVKDLNDLSEDAFIEKLEVSFDIQKIGSSQHRPSQKHEMGMYLNSEWYSLKAKEGTYDDNDPIKGLDVSILSECVLTPILNITDLRRDKRIDFVGGIRGLEELERRVDNGEMKVAFAMYPVSLAELMNIADTDNIMPPKTTWFEPKLRSGLFVHKLS